MYRAGQIIKFDYEHGGLVEVNHKFILAKTHKKDYMFQLICIEGYHAGEIEGYINKEPNHDFRISKEHLIKELKRNFLDIKWETFQIIE